MFQHILVPTDLSDKTKQALDVAMRMAVHENGRITLLHVVETIDDSQFEEFREFYSKLKKRAHKKMRDMISHYQGDDVAVDAEIIFGKRIREIVRFADEHHIDLVILSSHKVDLDNPGEGWGTISYKVGVLSQCPVMLVK